MSMIETMLGTASDGTILNDRLLDTWSVSPNGHVWTLNLTKNVPFHKGYGDFTADDVLWTIERGSIEGTSSARAKLIRAYFFPETGSQEKVDNHTLKLDIGEPNWQVLVHMQAPWTGAMGIFSKAQFDDVEADQMALNCVGTGPFEFMEHKQGSFMRLQAVEDHYRKTPNFAELTVWEIPEESTRIANFQTGKLDIMQMSNESMAAIENVSGIQFISQPYGRQLMILVRGQFYSEPREGYDPDRPWVSADTDPASAEWEKARKVREAMSLALDRQSLIDHILGGAGSIPPPWGWVTHEGQMKEIADLKYEYNPDRARQLLTEAGYSNGFTMDFQITPSIPESVTVGEAVLSMWDAVGIKTKATKLPYSTVRPGMVARTMNWPELQAYGSKQENILVYPTSINTAANWNSGVEHPFIDAKIQEGLATTDPDARWAVAREISQFIYYNWLHFPIVVVNVTWPVGPKVKPWDFMGAFSDNPTNWEYIELS
jgi:ABC-type transport system substrate-binding protein